MITESNSQQIVDKSELRSNNQLLLPNANYGGGGDDIDGENNNNVEDTAISNQVPVRYGSDILRSSPADDVSQVVDWEEIEAEIKVRIENVNELCKSYHLGKYKWSHNSSNDLGMHM